MQTTDRIEQAVAALEERYAMYDVVERGSLGVSYDASDRQRRHRVTVQVVHPHIADRISVERFVDALEAATALDHPGIVSLDAVEEIEGLPVLVWSKVTEPRLRDRLRDEGALPVQGALSIAHDVANAICFAHDYGLVHEALSPDTIVAAPGKPVRVMAWGVARALRAAGGEAVLRETLWREAMDYLSPELRVEPPEGDGRSDVYALGCVLYHMLVGEPPYPAPTPEASFARHQNDPVPVVSHRREGVSQTVDEAVSTALAKSPADRFRSASDLAAVLGARRQSVILARVPVEERLSRRNLRYAVTAGVALVLAALLGWFFT